MTLYGIASILVGISYFFGSFCPSVEDFLKQAKDTFSSSSSDGDSKDKDKGLVEKSYEIAKGTGKSVLKLLNVGKEGFITAYVTFGTSRDENGEINLWNWFDEAKKIHKGKKSETIFGDKDDNIDNSNQDEKVTENPKVKVIEDNKSAQDEEVAEEPKVIEENKSTESKKITKSEKVTKIFSDEKNLNVNFKSSGAEKTN